MIELLCGMFVFVSESLASNPSYPASLQLPAKAPWEAVNDGFLAFHTGSSGGVRDCWEWLVLALAVAILSMWEVNPWMEDCFPSFYLTSK